MPWSLPGQKTVSRAEEGAVPLALLGRNPDLIDVHVILVVAGVAHEADPHVRGKVVAGFVDVYGSAVKDVVLEVDPWLFYVRWEASSQLAEEVMDSCRNLEIEDDNFALSKDEIEEDDEEE